MRSKNVYSSEMGIFICDIICSCKVGECFVNML